MLNFDCMLKKLKAIDSFGAPIELNYRGDIRFRTIGGACATFLMALLILIYLCMQVIKVVGYGDP